ncbi:MAG: heavy metal translocating P-type ATPase [Pyramidobacter sp.]|nr:heavy metal translocating P-type ATPase [Pyramidobacter sp.]
MHNPLLNHDEISTVQSCPCCHREEKHSHDGAHERHHAHSHDHGHTHDHAADPRPHVHNPDGTIRYLAEGEVPPAPKLRRRTPTAVPAESCTCGGHAHTHDEQCASEHHHHLKSDEACGCPCCGHTHAHDEPHVTEHSGSDEECGCSCCRSDSPFAEKSEEENEQDEEDDQRGLLLAAVLFALSFIPSFPPSAQLTLHIGAFAAAGWRVALEAFEGLKRRDFFNENTLMLAASLGALALGDGAEAAAVMIFYRIGESLQDRAVRRSRRSIASLMNIRTSSARRIQNGHAELVRPEELLCGDEIQIAPGERVPADASVISGESALDQSALTGESLPRDVARGDEILSGAVNMTGTLNARVLRVSADSAASRILRMVDEAAARKAPTERFIRRFARVYTPAVFLAASLIAVVPPLFWGARSTWVYRALIFLVISCPCALVLSVPLTFFAGIGASTRLGVLLKGGKSLETLAKSDIIVYDKTGTLTRGNFKVSALNPCGVAAEELLITAAQAEQGSGHPIARSVVAECRAVAPQALGAAPAIVEHAGRGVCAGTGKDRVAVGSRELLAEEGICVPDSDSSGTAAVLHVARGGTYIGSIEISDEIKPDSAGAIAALRADGVSRQVMLTGDREEIARRVGSAVGLDEVRAGLLPDQKVEAMMQLKQQCRSGGTILFAGDGINDAPVLTAADAGIAMGQIGSDAAMEAADIVIMTDELSRLAPARRLAKRTLSIARQNVFFALSIKLGVMALGAAGYASMWGAMFADVGVALLAVLNALRAMNVSSVR